MLAAAHELPSWRSRQLAAWLTDHRGLAISASTVYRILRSDGLVKRVGYQLEAGKEYQHQTTGHRRLLLQRGGMGSVADPYRIVVMSDRAKLSCHALLLATGVSLRTLDVPGVERLTGAGEYYGTG